MSNTSNTSPMINNTQKISWNNMVHCEGTRAIFARRAKIITRFSKLRDVVGLCIPLVVVFLYTTDFVQNIERFKAIALGSLAVLALVQGCIVVYGIISGWDEDRAYSVRAIRDSVELRDNWESLTLPNVTNANILLPIYQARQSLLDSHDEERNLTDWERQFGMRAGLILCKRNCVCGTLPGSRRPPWFPKARCVVCGGNR